MKTLHVFRAMYLPNSAVTNRLLGQLKRFSERGIPVEMHFMLPNPNRDKCDIEIPGVTFRYWWDNQSVSNKYLRHLLSIYNAWKCRMSLNKGDSVLLLEMANYFLIFTIGRKFHVYYETTEHPLIGKLSYLKKKWRTWNAKYFSKKFDHIFVISTHLKKYYTDNGVPSEKVTIINMTVDASRFENLQKSSIREKYIAYCGTVSNNKDGVNLLIMSFAQVLKRYPDYKLYIIGATPYVNDESGNLKLIRDFGVEGSVVFTGVVKANEMPQLLYDAEILALERPYTLQGQYGFPTKLGEYLLTGNPVVVTSVGDMPLFLEDGVSAYIAPPDNPEAFAEKLIYAIENVDKSKCVGERGKSIAMRFFNYQIEGDKMVDIIQDTIQQ